MRLVYKKLRQKAALPKLRYFAGLTMAEAVEVIGVSVRTADRQLAFARAWLFRDIRRRKEKAV